MPPESEQDQNKKFFVLLFVLAWVATVFFMNHLVHAYYQKDYTVLHK